LIDVGALETPNVQITVSLPPARCYV